MRKNSHDRILKDESKEQHLNTVRVSLSLYIKKGQGFAANHFLHIGSRVKILKGHLSMTNLKKTSVKFLTFLPLTRTEKIKMHILLSFFLKFLM